MRRTHRTRRSIHHRGRIVALGLALAVVAGCGSSDDIEAASEKMVAAMDATVRDLDDAGMIDRLAKREVRLPTLCTELLNRNQASSTMTLRIVLADGVDQAELTDVLVRRWRDDGFEPSIGHEEEGSFIMQGADEEIQPVLAVFETRAGDTAALQLSATTACSDLVDGHDQETPFTEDFYEQIDPDGDRFDDGL